MIYYAPYRLETLGALNAKTSAQSIHGVLLRHEDGVGCLQPWPTLGDEPLEFHLASLAQGKPTAMAMAALECCRVDGKARRAGKSLFTGLTIPPSHATLTTWPCLETCSQLRSEGFTHIKIKANGQSKEWGFASPTIMAPIHESQDLCAGLAKPRSLAAQNLAEHIESLADCGLKLRLDFNHTASASLLSALSAALSPSAKLALDFIEDPFPYDADAWNAIEQSTGFSLALDRGQPQLHAPRISIWKPATESHRRGSALAPNHCSRSAFAPSSQHSERGRSFYNHESEGALATTRTIVTSNMDHAIGQMYAAYIASLTCPNETCGLLTHVLFQQDEFFARIQSRGPNLSPTPGTGLGFDDLLEKLPWTSLA